MKCIFIGVRVERDDAYVKHMKEFCSTYPRNKNSGDADIGDIIDVKVHNITWKHSKLCGRLKSVF